MFLKYLLKQRCQKIVLTLLMLFLSSLLAIIAGYYNTLVGLDMAAVKWVFEGVPVFRASIVLTLSCPVYLLIAFYFSRGNYEYYKSELIGFSIIIPIILVLVLLPGETSKPDHLQLNYKSMLFLVCASQYLATKFIQDAVWVVGGRKIQT